MTDAPYSLDWLRRMVVESLVRPRAAGEELLSLPLRRDALWMWLALLSVLNGILYSLTLPSEAELGMSIPPFVASPIILSIFVAVIMLLMTWFFTMAGRMLGGRGDFGGMLQVTCWLQSLRLGFQIIVTLFATLTPGLGGLLAFVGGIWSLYILANFLTAVHRFETPMRAIGVMVIGVIGVAFAMTFILTLFGAGPSGS
ncbi:Yip1 family protein [Pseudooceanicola sp.]|uniref:Yip1 family protein n=1 Tax=Pseudooceanicola sp. TaxID=1914328 RepID=UPI0040585376